MKPKQKKPKRRRPANASLIPKLNPRIRQEYLDLDYLDQLSPEETAWMAKFMDEWNGASFKKDGTDIDQTPEGYKAATDRNNARNRDIYGILKNKANRSNNKRLVNFDNNMTTIEDPFRSGGDPLRIENAYIDFIEFKEIEAMIKEYDQAMSNFNEDDE